MKRISVRFRLALAAKGFLLLLLGALFVALLWRASFTAERHLVVRAIGLVFFGVPAVFLGWTCVLAFADVVLGQTTQLAGAVALASRRSGISFRGPDGRPAEFILFNSWAKTEPHHAYDLVVGRYSRVIVEAPRSRP